MVAVNFFVSNAFEIENLVSSSLNNFFFKIEKIHHNDVGLQKKSDSSFVVLVHNTFETSYQINSW
jgi:hypothetical protein